MANIAFRPVRCLEAALETMQPIEGHVIFTTDTHKIYAVIDGEFQMMGGSSGVYYGNRSLTEDEKYGDEVFFSFTPEDIEGDNMPTVDDLILNIPDGGFYRVLSSSDIEISTQRIAISGSGGGAGGGGGGVSNEGSLAINYITPQNSSTITGVDYFIEFEVVAKDSAGDPIQDEGVATWKINGKEYTTTVKNGKNEFQVDQYLDPTIDKNKIILVVSMNTGGVNNSIISKTWYVKAVSLSLTWDYNYNERNYVSGDTFTLSWYSYGGVDCTAHIIFDNNYNPGVTYFTKEHKATGNLIVSNSMPSLSYGAHSCEIYLTTTVNGEEYRTPSIFNEVTFIGGGSSTILTVPYYSTEATQYDTLRIPFLVYDPDLESCEVGFYVNDNLVSVDTYNRNLQYWPYTLTEFGTIKLSIQSTNGESKKDINLVVNKLELDCEEADGYAFSLKANNFSSNNELRNWNQNGVTLEFSENFDWDNGGIKFETKANGSIEKFICVRQGTTMTVKYPLFSNRDTARNGKDFKINFKAANCYDYSAPVMSCYEENSGVGVRLEAQQAIFSSATFPSFATQYFENSYIELESEIWPDVEDKDPDNNLYGDRFIMFWVDGVPAGVKAFPRNENFNHLQPTYITVGSDLCDVYVYVMKVYERKLTEEEHLNNFIMDAPSTEEMLDRYRRNDILDNTGEISYTRLVEKNPACRAYLYEMDHMTQSKNDKVKDCTYTELFGDYNSLDNPYYSAEGVEVYAQGTSSAAYGAAAFNLRSKFKKGLTDKDGNQVEGWRVTETAMPIELPCTKVNVASCENVNNVVNQEWYNRFQPYHDAHRRKNDGNAYRDTMQFESGVLFIKDNNPNDQYLGTGSVEDKTSSYLAANCFLDAERNGIPYAKNPFYKMYAIANMGNDKKNVEVFHDVENPKACCIEVTDNQNAEHWMTVPVTMEQFGLEKPHHEFRYPDGNDEASTEQKQAWIDFVDWMAHSDPSPYNAETHPFGYTGEELPEAVTYGDYTFKGFDPPGYEGKVNPSGISLKGLKITEYSGTYTHDTREYRIAKMLNECEDHLVMDSVVFHYLFIQRHTMVDNVAKNTFWSTEDLVHWDLTKDYDNDTSDGNNNSGYLTFTYGIENLDKTESGADVFNASDSVWIQFIHGLEAAQKKMHQDLANKGAWKATAYLEECLRHQNAIPERCWIYNYFHHYIRPRRLGLDENTFLNRLEGGKKTHQRKQYENYQEFYLNSKYLADTAFTDGASIDMRLNKDPQGQWDINNALEVSFYTDCYPSIHIGGKLHRSPDRLKRGQTYDLPVGSMIQSANDSTCYLYGAGMLQTLNGLAQTYPSYVKLANASKLRSIAYGSSEEGYYNPNLTSLDIGSNAMLQYAQAQNSGTAEGIGATDLGKASQLKQLLLNGSTLKSLILPENGIIETLALNPLATLSMSNLIKLTSVTLDEEIYSTMQNLTVKNCPAMDEYTYRMVLEAPITNYALTEFEWVVDAENGLVIEDGKVVGLTVLDKLMTKLPNGGTTAAALIGKITVDINCNIDEFEIYKKYCKTYPNLIIEYTDKVLGLNPAVELTFMSGEEDTAVVHYRVLGSGEITGAAISELISASGPLGVAMTTPIRQPITESVFTFTGYWKSGDKYYYLDSDVEEPREGAISFSDLHPVTDMIFYPEFITSVREYEIKFMDYAGNIIKQNGEDAYLVPYGSTYRAAGGPLTNYYYRDSADLRDEQRYGFQGWSTNKYGTEEIKNPVYINLDTYQIQGPMTLFPHYLIEDVRKVPTDISYFNVSGSTISLKQEYREVFEGKITIPTVSGVTHLGQISKPEYNANNRITHMYFLNDSAITEIDMSALSYCPVLKIVDLPSTVRAIRDYAFTSCPELISVTLNDNITEIGGSAFTQCSKLELTALPKHLKKLGMGAFMSTGAGIQITSLPEDLEVLYSYTFYGCENVKIANFGAPNGKLKEIQASCLESAGRGNVGPSVTEINIYDSVEIIGADAFRNYASNTLKDVYFARPWQDGESVYGENVSGMGFKTDGSVNFADLV